VKRNLMATPALLAGVSLMGCALMGCAAKKKGDPAAEAPPAAQVESAPDPTNVKVDHPEQFPVVTAGMHSAAPELNATGSVNPDVSRQVPVISLAMGRITEIHARLGDVVTKGQLLLKVQSADISGAFSDYEQAVVDLTLAKSQLERAKILYEKGAIAQKDLEVAVDVEQKAEVTIRTTEQHLKVLGADKDHPSPILDITAPVTGVVTDQQVTNAGGVQGLGSPPPFTITDLSYVWVVCDVYENDLGQVNLGEFADIHINAFPNRLMKGRISNIGPILDPNIRTAKVRLEVENPGALRLGMFATVTFHGLRKESRAAVPASAILHLHDREWVYTPNGDGRFKRLEVTAGNMLPNNMQEIVTGLSPGQQVVANALILQNTVEQ
jgi:cobalt-zinc-cadmium efflux system membrane fusion protein